MTILELYDGYGLSLVVLAILALITWTLRKRIILPSILDRIAGGRRPSSKTGSPQSKSSEKKPSAPSSNHKFTLPPTTYQNLLKATTEFSDKSKLQRRDAVDDAVVLDGIVPFEANYTDCAPSSYTPMGISLAEVRALGDFPRYDRLSDVPLPTPYKEFKIETAVARPYRPLRWAYHQTMALSNLEPDWWLELESTYVERVREREELYRNHGKGVLQYLPGSELGCKETMEHALQFLCARYPQHFSLTHESSRGHVFTNKLLRNETVVRDHHPLIVLLHNVPEDFAVMVRNPEDGLYYFRAGLLCSSLGWSVDTKIGMVLREIHDPIPDYREKMAMSMDRFFSKMPPAKPIQRGSWGLEIDTPLFMPPGHPHEAYRSYQLPPSELPASRLHLRVDWQTLRRLPLSGAIVFNFKALFTPLMDMRREPGVPQLLRKVLREGKESIMKYKGTWHVEHVVLPLLREWGREQEREGLVEPSYEPKTLDESPFFPGWEEAWHRKQGF